VRPLTLQDANTGQVRKYAWRVGFFDDLRPPPPPEELPEEEVPEWSSAPEGWIGSVVAVAELIGRSDEAAVCLSRVVAYPIGFEVTLDVFTRSRSWGYAFDRDAWAWQSGEATRPPPELLRYGIEFSDGRKASNVGAIGGTMVALEATGDEPALDPAKDLSLVPEGGSGGGRHSRQDLWVWPLPPPGPVAFVCEWPQYGIPEARVEIDGHLIREAATEAKAIWPASPRLK
jgi:hypothetical protein